MMVPAVTEVCLPHPAHSQVHGLVCSSQALLVPQPGQAKPSGQRAAKGIGTGCLIREALLELDQGTGKSVTRVSGRAVVLHMF